MKPDEFVAAVRKLAAEVSAPAELDELRLIVSFDRKRRRGGQLVVQPTFRYGILEPQRE